MNALVFFHNLVASAVIMDIVNSATSKHSLLWRKVRRTKRNRLTP
jgi:hypothetical protein